MLDEGGQVLAERPGILLAQVDLVLRAADGEPHGLVSRAALQIVFERDCYLRCHSPSSLLRWATCTVQDQLPCRGPRNAPEAGQPSQARPHGTVSAPACSFSAGSQGFSPRYARRWPAKTRDFRGKLHDHVGAKMGAIVRSLASLSRPAQA